MPAAPQTPPTEEIVSRFEKFLEENEPESFATEEPERKPEKKPSVDQSAKEASPAAKPDEADAADEAASEEPEAETPESGGSPEKEAKAKEAAASTEEEGIETLGELATYFGVEEPALLETLQIVPTEGADPISLKQVVDAYQGLPSDSEAAKEFSEEREAFQIKAKEREEAYGQEFQRLQVLTSALITMIEGDKNDEELVKLKEYDAPEYIRRTEQLAQRRGLVEKALSEMKGKQQSYAQDQAEQTKERNKRELAAIYRAKPEWRDKAAGEKAMAQIDNYAKSRGFTDEDLESLTDHRSILTLWDASEHARLRERTSKARKEKRLLKIPQRSLKRGARMETTQADEARKRIDAKYAKLRKSGDVGDAASLIEDLLED